MSWFLLRMLNVIWNKMLIIGCRFSHTRWFLTWVPGKSNRIFFVVIWIVSQNSDITFLKAFFMISTLAYYYLWKRLCKVKSLLCLDLESIFRSRSRKLRDLDSRTRPRPRESRGPRRTRFRSRIYNLDLGLLGIMQHITTTCMVSPLLIIDLNIKHLNSNQERFLRFLQSIFSWLWWIIMMS